MRKIFIRISRKISLWNINKNNRIIFGEVDCNIDEIIVGPDININFNIKYGGKLKIGDGTVINGNCYINAFGGVVIGQYCHIGTGLTVFSHNHNYKSTKYIPYDDVNIERKVTIGDAVWIGANVTIAPGTTIGNGVIISAGSVVFGNIPNCAIIRGNPAEIIKYREIDVFNKLYKEMKFK